MLEWRWADKGTVAAAAFRAIAAAGPTDERLLKALREAEPTRQAVFTYLLIESGAAPAGDALRQVLVDLAATAPSRKELAGVSVGGYAASLGGTPETYKLARAVLEAAARRAESLGGATDESDDLTEIFRRTHLWPYPSPTTRPRRRTRNLGP